MKKLKKEKGITLVALIITIVVLLILAVVAIGAITDSNIIAHAQNAATSYNKAKANEVDFLGKYEKEIDKYNPSKETNEEVVWGEYQGMLCYIGTSNDIKVTSDIIQVQEITVDLATMQYTKVEGTIKEVKLSDYPIIALVFNNDIETIDFGNNLSSTVEIQHMGFNKLKEVKGLNNIRNIGLLFEGCTSLTSIEIPDSVTSIGSDAFKGCTSLTSIEIPDSVTSIGSNAFRGCTSLTSIEIPDSVTSIGSNAFEGCTSLTSLKIPEGTELIYCTFQKCSNLESLELPSTISQLYPNSFAGCPKLNNITIHKEKGTLDFSSSGLTEEQIANINWVG